MKKHYLILLLVAAVGCDSVGSGTPDELMVVEAFLFAGEPVNNIRVTEAIPRAIVYRVNKEYADLYSGLEQDSRDLNEPSSNIKGGLGVFSAFAGQEARFQVVAVTGS